MAALAVNCKDSSSYRVKFSIQALHLPHSAPRFWLSGGDALRENYSTLVRLGGTLLIQFDRVSDLGRAAGMHIPSQ